MISTLHNFIILKPSFWIQRHVIFTVISVIIIVFIINFILFSIDNDDVNKGHFNRNIIESEENGKLIKKYVSSPALDACHYTFSTISTVGYGDISPKTSVAKSWTIFYHMLTIILSLKLFDYYYNKDSVTLESLKNRVENLSLENVMLNDINKTLTKNKVSKENSPYNILSDF